jgi:hypothetical protein
MPRGPSSSLFRVGSALALLFVLGACTAGGQFDPTEVVSTDLFNTKKKLNGDREPLFPQGVPGAETGVPPDLVKGYQPPPEPVAPEAGDAAAKSAAAAEKPKPKPKPKVARAPAPQARDPVWNQKAPASAPPPAGQAAQSPWPAPPSQAGQGNWPAPPGAQSQAAPAAQTNWPAPPPARQTQ